MNLPAELVAYLRSEAYTTLCRRSLLEALDAIEKEKEQVLATKPPFGMLASKEARAAYQTSLRAVLDNEEGLRRRIARLVPIDAWLDPLIPRCLHKYLIASSTDYQYYHTVCDAVKLWEVQVEALRDKAIALARDSRTLAIAAGGGPSRLTGYEATATLRATVVTVVIDLAEIAATAARVAQLSTDELPAAARLPAVPQFRSTAWVERLAEMPPAAAVAELERCEAEARAFAREGYKPLIEQAAKTHAACVRLREDYLQASWQEAREYALTHYVKERDVDDVIEELHASHLADVQHRQRELIHNSFEFAGAR